MNRDKKSQLENFGKVKKVKVLKEKELEKSTTFTWEFAWVLLVVVDGDEELLFRLVQQDKVILSITVKIDSPTLPLIRIRAREEL